MCYFCASKIFFLREASFEKLGTDKQMLASQTRNLIKFEVFRIDSEGHLFAQRIVFDKCFGVLTGPSLLTLTARQF